MTYKWTPLAGPNSYIRNSYMQAQSVIYHLSYHKTSPLLCSLACTSSYQKLPFHISRNKYAKWIVIWRNHDDDTFFFDMRLPRYHHFRLTVVPHVSDTVFFVPFPATQYSQYSKSLIPKPRYDSACSFVIWRPNKSNHLHCVFLRHHRCKVREYVKLPLWHTMISFFPLVCSTFSLSYATLRILPSRRFNASNKTIGPRLVGVGFPETSVYGWPNANTFLAWCAPCIDPFSPLCAFTELLSVPRTAKH